METHWILWLTLGETALVAALYLLLPRISRRGLLFGVYIGEEAAGGPEARAITRSWYRRMTLWTLAALGLGLAAGEAFGPAWSGPSTVLLLTAGFFASYLPAHLRARTLAPPAGPPGAVAALEEEPPGSLVLPYVVLATGVAAGLYCVAHAAVHYPQLPALVPVHFGPSGEPDGWAPKSPLAVMLLPAMTLVLGTGMGIITVLTARAKRALRSSGGRASLAAQRSFRRAVTRMLAAVSLLTAALLTVTSVYSIRTALGLEAGVPPAALFLGLALMAVALGGVLYIALRIGQGGSRLEEADASHPLTDGLADNRRWVLGIFYVNREDPSILVEHRFGLGYTVNLGNPKAVAIFGGFVALVLLLTALSLTLL